ncbi:hypothetical protein [Paenibacillus hamazuiensis]|uniref:hypothetical protein n=1 Tax=Paenibacillus hamazuiensis TaxID=2936508 RepID=UPI00200F3C65|nr:hypothetical protein [Paenibacillus hamazuiensis]
MMKKIMIPVLVTMSLLFSAATPAFASNVSSDSNSVEANKNGIGRVAISTVPLPSSVKKLESSTYTYSGKVLIIYKTENDINTADFWNIAVLNDDGTNFKVIYSGVIPTKPKSPGIRIMPFQDNKRVLLGDYVLECAPSIDNSTSAKIVPVVFPSSLVDDARITRHWSEIIIAPDNKHMSWTILRSDIGGAAAIGVLDRKTDSYVLEKVQLISTIPTFKNDPNRPGFMIPNPLRGGEVKQFVKGGNAISVVGGKAFSTPDSVVQDLNSENTTQITYTPGYDETTIFSPDERLGMVMSTRFSEHTDPAIFGLMPRPYGIYTFTDMMWPLYTYAITGVRNFRDGNIGPVLIDINRSKTQAGYKGVQLTTDTNWVYYSPMSWHPEGKRAMWLEVYRGSGGSQMRIQKVDLLDYKPHKPVPIKPTTDNIPYGIKDLTVLSSVNPNVDGKIAGKSSGYLIYKRSGSSIFSGQSEVQYVNFSDDGVNFYNGYEKTTINAAGESRYEANVQLTGAKQGETKFRATFSALGGATPAKLLFDTDADGKPKSYGYATYNGITLNIEDLLE